MRKKALKLLILIRELLEGEVSLWGIKKRFRLFKTFGRITFYYVYYSFEKPLSEGKYDEVEKKLKAWYIDAGLTNKEIEEIIYTIKLLPKQEKDFFYRYEALIKEFGKKDISVFNMEQWNCLASFFSASGLLRLGHLCRENAKKRCLQHRHLAKKSRFAIYFEQGDYDKLNKVYSQIHKSIIFGKSEKEQYQQIVCFVNQKSFKALENIQENASEFKKYVKGKKIAVCGPAPAGQDELTALESMDVYVSINYLSKFRLDGEIRKYPITISYYNGDTIATIKKDEERYLKEIEDLKFIACSGLFLKEANKIKFVNDNTPINKCFFWGYPNKIQQASLHLCLNSEKPVYVCRTTLFLSKRAYAKGYAVSEPHLRNQNTPLFMPFAVHNPTANFMFLKKLKEIGWIIPDTDLEKILEKSAEKYIEELEKTYYAKFSIM